MLQRIKKIACSISLLAGLNYFAIEASGQIIAKENFKQITKTYTDYIVDKLHLNSDSIVFFVSTDTHIDGLFFFEITVRNTNALYDLKYDNLYKLGKYKIVLFEGFNTHNILRHSFINIPYEDVNKGKNPGIRINRDDFVRWYFIMNKKYEVVELYAVNEAFDLLKKNKVLFSKEFKPH